MHTCAARCRALFKTITQERLGVTRDRGEAQICSNLAPVSSFLDTQLDAVGAASSWAV